MLSAVQTLPAFTDADLVRRASHGDRAAFGKLYERYARVVHGILLSRVPSSDAEDLVQDVFVIVMKKLPMLRTPEAFPAWLAAIARNQAFDYYRVTRVADELSDSAIPQRAGVVNHIGAASALAAIRALPEAYRETLVLRLVEGFTGPEIAQRTGLTADSVRVNLCRGMKLLREKLGTET